MSTVRFARPMSDFRRRRVHGLLVRGNVLAGTLLVDLKQDRGLERDRDYSPERILMFMRRINRRTSDGYGIRLAIRKKTTLERIYTSVPTVTVFVVRTMAGNECEGAVACYDFAPNAIRITPDATDAYVVHELFHKLGLGHSGHPRSVMLRNQGARSYSDAWTFANEVRALVDAYR